MDVCDMRQLRPLLERHGFHFSKSRGQNFLIASWVPENIAAACGAGRDCGVLEIGPGVGALTRQLSARAGKVAAVELDRDLLPILAETLAGCDNVEIIPGDVLKLDLQELAAEKFAALKPIVCANLPYNITSPVLTALLRAECFSSITVMVQREVALRICAQPGTADYGAFSVLCQFYAAPELLFHVPPSCFLPAPKVTSSVVRLTLRPALEGVEDRDFFFRVVRAAFAQRRKTLLNSLSACLGAPYDKAAVSAAMERCGLPADVRGERLDLAQFAALAQILREINGEV